jgi:hypothetical protein
VVLGGKIKACVNFGHLNQEDFGIGLRNCASTLFENSNSLWVLLLLAW